MFELEASAHCKSSRQRTRGEKWEFKMQMNTQRAYFKLICIVSETVAPFFTIIWQISPNACNMADRGSSEL
eukprot:4586373-Ditylum_brightwellii.AAC.1